MVFILDFPISEKKCLKLRSCGNAAWKMIIKFLWESAYIYPHISLRIQTVLQKQIKPSIRWVNHYYRQGEVLSEVQTIRLYSGRFKTYFLCIFSFSLRKLTSSQWKEFPLLKQWPLLGWYSGCWNEVQGCWIIYEVEKNAGGVQLHWPPPLNSSISILLFKGFVSNDELNKFSQRAHNKKHKAQGA